MEDDVITRFVSFFYPDPTETSFLVFSSITWQNRFFIRISFSENSFFYPFSVKGPKIFASNQNPDKKALWIRIKKRICHVNGENQFFSIRIKKRNQPRDDVIFHKLFRIKQLPPRILILDIESWSDVFKMTLLCPAYTLISVISFNKYCWTIFKQLIKN